MTKFKKEKAETLSGERKDNRFSCKIRKKKRTYSSGTLPLQHMLMHTVQLFRHDAYTVQWHCPVNALIMPGNSQSE